MIDDYDTVLITVFGQGIDFTKEIDKVIINTNQCISFCVQCVDGPTYPTRKLAVYENNVFLPLRIQDTNCLEKFLPI